jgi:hypothetical protein
MAMNEVSEKFFFWRKLVGIWGSLALIPDVRYQIHSSYNLAIRIC